MQIKIRYGYTDGKNWIFQTFTIEEIENGSPYEVLSDNALLKKYKLTTRDMWTGLTDKNGVGVFEHDSFDGIHEEGWIEYCEECKSMQYKIKDFGCMACEGDVHLYEIIEAIESGEICVIGNIHENPVK